MSKSARFSALSTKCRAIEKNLMTVDQYKELLSFTTPEEVLVYIAEHTSIGEDIKDICFEKSTRIIVERIFSRYIFTEYKKIGNFMVGTYKDLYKTFMMRFEVENIKSILRAVQRGEPEEEVMAGLLRLGKCKNNIDYDTLVKSQSIEDVVNSLKKTIYYEPLMVHLGENQLKILFHMELALDKLYFSKLAEQSEYLSRQDRDMMKMFVGRSIDIQNIQLLYRAFKTFNISSEEKFNYAKKGGLEIDLRKLKKLSYISDLESFITAIGETSYAFLFDNIEDADFSMEILAERYLYNIYKTERKKNPMSIASVVEYMHFIEYTVRDLTTIVEAKRYGYPAEDIHKFLVIPFAGKKVVK